MVARNRGIASIWHARRNAPRVRAAEDRWVLVVVVVVVPAVWRLCGSVGYDTVSLGDDGTVGTIDG